MGLQKESRNWGEIAIRSIVGIGLLAVAGMATLQLHGDMSSGQPSSLPRWLTMGCVEIEILLGLWLLSGLAMRKATLLVCLFLAIAGASSFYTAIRGGQNILPAGPAGMSPWAVAASAFAAALFLVVFWPAGTQNMRRTNHRVRLAVTAIAALALVGASIPLACSGPGVSLPKTPSPQATGAPGKFQPVIMGPSNVDLGFVEPASVHEVYFTITNPNDAPFPIKNFRTSCDCAAVKDAPAAVAPRTTVRVRLTYTAPKERTNASTMVTMTPADKGQPAQSLHVLAAVGMPLEVKPSLVKLGTLIDGQVATSEFTILNHGTKTVRPLYSTSSTPGCFAPISQGQIAPGGQLVIPIVVQAHGPSAGTKTVQIAIHTDCDGQDTVIVQGGFDVASDYKIAPGKIDLGALKAGQKKTFTINLTTTKPAAGKFVQKTVAEGASSIAALPSVSYDGPKATISLDVTAGEKPGPIGGRLVINLAGREAPLLVPIEGRVESSPPAATRN